MIWKQALLYIVGVSIWSNYFENQFNTSGSFSQEALLVFQHFFKPTIALERNYKHAWPHGYYLQGMVKLVPHQVMLTNQNNRITVISSCYWCCVLQETLEHFTKAFWNVCITKSLAPVDSPDSWDFSQCVWSSFNPRLHFVVFLKRLPSAEFIITISWLRMFLKITIFNVLLIVKIYKVQLYPYVNIETNNK